MQSLCRAAVGEADPIFCRVSGDAKYLVVVHLGAETPSIITWFGFGSGGKSNQHCGDIVGASTPVCGADEFIAGILRVGGIAHDV